MSHNEKKNDNMSEVQQNNTDEVEKNSLDYLQTLTEENFNYVQGGLMLHNASSKEKYSSVPLAKEEKLFENVRDTFMNLMFYCEGEMEEEIGITYFRSKENISDIQKASLLAHAIAAQASILNESLVHKIEYQILLDTSMWFSSVFWFQDSLAYFSRDSNAGLVHIVRMVLHSRYPKYVNLGYEAVFTRPPVIYYCDSVSPGLGQSLCIQLGLPLTCLTPVPCYSGATDRRYKMDISALEKYISDDIAAAKTPLLVVANAGIPLVGYGDSLQKIEEICHAHNVWLHVKGHNLAALSLVSTSNLFSDVGSSLTLNFGSWVGLRNLTTITLYKRKDLVLNEELGLQQNSCTLLDTLPVWVVMQILGLDSITQKIHHCFHLASVLLKAIEAFSELRVISQRMDSAECCDVTEIREKNIPAEVLLESLTCVIVFQYIPSSYKEDSDDVKRNPAYYDNLNSWLMQLLSRNVPKVGIDILYLDVYGICLRICPLETAHMLETSQEDVEEFIINLQQQINILNSTVLQKEKLYETHNNHSKLQLVEIANWAGMGGVRYIPDFWVNRLNELTDTGKEDINQLNSELVAKLRVSDTAFSLGEADDGMLCVRFGMVDDKLDMEELLNLVISSGQEIEESSKFLETMSEMVKHGIEEATKELIQENQEKIMQEGILRQVPVIGSLYSWWYPIPKETGIKGRSFNLSSGTIESTENIYRYHMQLKGASKSPPAITKVCVSPNPCKLHANEEDTNAVSQSN